ncbi:membrane protein insertase YidC [Amphritea pacifica]|uniref:Membrane protein insertase YidC n=1 Tax=Amphritea pacifica TaxID=2811233 RepID=A0ABS2W2B0_9GAMM|nr:membrane protein insertase YidC [Amphritea pacifica]MBN0985834.1 membrane protein insertase YidC [Amphritea pacifica]MBN1005915.1 membrane protein insertase YidC [Amphritea pacifica]
MDVQRIILIAALAIISYMLVLQWNQDYGAQPVAVAQPGSVSAYQSSNETAASQAGDLPPATTTEAAANNDLPEAQAVATTAQQQLISVKTDVLELLIDTKGGDIIQLTLPKHKAALNDDKPFVLLENGNRTYVSQSGLIGKDGLDAKKEGRPQYTTAKNSYQMEGDKLTVDLVHSGEDGVVVTKRFVFTKGSYKIEQDFLINNGSAEVWQAKLFGQIKRDGSKDPSQTTSMGMQAFLGAVFSTADEHYDKFAFKKLDETNVKKTSIGGWVAMSQHYFLSAWIPAADQENNYSSRVSNGNYIASFVAPEFSVAPGETKTVSAGFYAGPKETDLLEQAAPNLELTVDYGILWFIASPLSWLLKTIHSFVGNWGVSIIFITIIVKALLFQVNAKAFKSMAKMRKFGPEMTRLKELYGDDRQKMSQAMMELYKKEKINPLGGCLPIVAQMPIFIALYWTLMESVELRHAPFALWINDLSVMDPYFMLPILMGATMFIQQLLNPTPPDPMQAKIMKMLPIVFTFFFLWFPAGLVLYWLVNNILSITQQYIINKQIEAEGSK